MPVPRLLETPMDHADVLLRFTFRQPAMNVSYRTQMAFVVAIVGFCVFAALGTWQVERRAWKLGLIARVEQRARAPAQAAPTRQQWSHVTVTDDEYRHVRATGVFLNAEHTLVRASTELGSGYWVMTPLQLEDGSSIIVNRGFITDDQRAVLPRAGDRALTTVTGLLRITEPRGLLFLRNDPSADRWYWRDIAAIARARGLIDVAPYFIDADASHTDTAKTVPIGGLTVIRFHNNHLIYACTWFTLAVMIPGAWWIARKNAA
jgi:surfeit locus 1 family protein